MDEDKRANALKEAARKLFRAWWDTERATGTPYDVTEAAFVAGLNMALEAQVYFLLDDMPIIATNIIIDKAVLFVTDEKVSKLIFTGE